MFHQEPITNHVPDPRRFSKRSRYLPSASSAHRHKDIYTSFQTTHSDALATILPFELNIVLAYSYRRSKFSTKFSNPPTRTTCTCSIVANLHETSFSACRHGTGCICGEYACKLSRWLLLLISAWVTSGRVLADFSKDTATHWRRHKAEAWLEVCMDVYL